jgi:hypothetical protein
MNIQDMSVLNTMKKNVGNATLETIDSLLLEVPLLIKYAEASKREIKLELLQISRSIIEKLVELDPEVVKDPHWQSWGDLKTKLDTDIIHTRFLG